MRPLLVIDGDSFAHRAYHALPKSIRRADRRPAGALVGFANMLIRLWEAEEPRTVLVAWDTLEVPTYRHQAFESYQSGREFDAELLEQLALLPELVASFGFAVAKGDGYEADDFLAAAADAETERGGQALVATSDRDAFQLASANVTILQPTRGVSEIARIGPAEVRERYGVEPAQVPGLHRPPRRPLRQAAGRPGRRPEDGGADPRRVRLARGRARGGTVLGRGRRAAAVPADRAARPLGSTAAARRHGSRLGRGGHVRGQAGARRPRRAARGEGRGIEVVSNEAMQRLHPTGPHPESAERLQVLLASLERWNECGPATEDDVARCHDRAYIERIREISSPTWLDPDTVGSATSYDGAMLSAGAAIEAARQECFALARPPGHHALSARAMGFCLFGNVAVAARYAQAELESSESRSSTGTSTTETARRRSSGTTRASSSSRSTSGRSIPAAAGRTSRTRRR